MIVALIAKRLRGAQEIGPRIGRRELQRGRRQRHRDQAAVLLVKRHVRDVLHGLKLQHRELLPLRRTEEVLPLEHECFARREPHHIALCKVLRGLGAQATDRCESEDYEREYKYQERVVAGRRAHETSGRATL